MAGRKRKAEAARAAEEEADRALYGAFRGAANSLSQLYAMAGCHQRLSFHAGERHALLRYIFWKNRVPGIHLFARSCVVYGTAILQYPVFSCGETMSSLSCLVLTANAIREKLYQWMVRQHESGMRLTVSDIAANIEHEIAYGGDGALTSPRSQYTTQNLQAQSHIPNTSTQQLSSCSSAANPSKDSMVFSKALSSPFRQNLQLYHIQQGGHAGCFADGIFSTGNRDSNLAVPNDSSVDMHSDSPGHDS